MKKIAILSPHLDDAVLDCGEHIFDWKKKKKDISVVTIFARFGSNNTINSIKNRLAETGFSSCQEQERIRKKEDISAMEKLGVSWEHWEFIEGGYRTHRNQLLYPDNRSLFSGIISPHDLTLVQNLEARLVSLKNIDKVVAPLGIGRNADHLIVRKVAEKIFPDKQLSYYIDYPYALLPRNWTLKNFFKLVLKRKSIKPMSDEKRDMMNLYKSQIPLLFKSRIPNYPEIILSG